MAGGTRANHGMKKQGRHPERALSAALIRTVKKPTGIASTEMSKLLPDGNENSSH